MFGNVEQRVPKVLKTWSECVAGNLAVLRKMSQDMVNRLYFILSMRFFAGEDYEKAWIVNHYYYYYFSFT